MSQVFDNTRLLRVLLPPGYVETTDLRYPVLYLLDGQTLFDAADSYTSHVWEVDQVVSSLLSEGAIDPLIVVGDRLLLQVAPCGQHDERHYRRRLPRGLSFLYGSAPGGPVIQRFEGDHGE